MDKSTLKTKYDPIRRIVIKEMVKSTGFTYQFIADAAANRKNSETAQKVRREFQERYERIKNALKSK